MSLEPDTTPRTPNDASLQLSDRQALLVRRLAPYARSSLNEAATFALWLHAKQVEPEHLLAALLGDEECGATRLVLHAFADPETIAIEVTALCEGIMVVGSGRSLPFSLGGIAATERARALAAQRGEGSVEVEHVFVAVLEELTAELEDCLRAAGFASAGRELSATQQSSTPVPAVGPLFRSYSNAARRALGGACRIAAQLQRRSISPVHLLLACLEADPDLRERAGLTPTRARMALAGRDEDPQLGAASALPLGQRLEQLLQAVEEPAHTLDLLGRLLTHGSEEVRALLRRQKVTPELWESVQRARTRFEDADL